MLARLSLVLVVFLACGDEEPPPTCDDSTPCVSEMESFCDLEGVHGGEPMRCIERPSAGACSGAESCEDPALPRCSGRGFCVECTNFSHCNGGAPVCNLSTNECGPCRSGREGDDVCGAIDSFRPRCGPGGTCVECIEAADCSLVDKPVCDESTWTCRGCESGPECDSGVCNEGTGVCESA